MSDFGKVLTAMVTPFDEFGKIDINKVKYLANYLVNNGSDGIVVSGTTGESPTLTEDEKLKLFETVLTEVGHKVTVIAGTGSNNTTASLQLSKKAESIGMHGVMLVAPYYNKPSQEGLYRHFNHIAQEINIPVMLYNVPSRTMTNVLPDTVVRLSQLENIVAIKEASGDMDQVSTLQNKLPKDFSIYSGDDSLTLPMLALGCQGVVSVASHIVGKDIHEMINNFLAGNVSEAVAIHSRLFKLFKALFITTNPVPVKTALNLMGFDLGDFRLPLIEATPSERELIKQSLIDLGRIE